MKFATRRMPLPVEEFGTTNGGEELWIELPVTVKEGFAKEVRQAGEHDPDARKANARILQVVTDWNLDDDDGKPLPLIRSFDAEKDWSKIEAVLAEMPLPLFAFIGRAVTRTPTTESILGNSRT